MSQGCEAKLTMYPGAIEAFDRAIAADPTSPSPIPPARTPCWNAATPPPRARRWRRQPSLAAGLPDREASHIAYFALLVAGDTEAALAALPTHLDAWPRDILVLGTTAFTNGLIGSSGRAGQKRTLLALLDQLSPHYGDDWWFTAHHGMALSRTASTTPPARRSSVPSAEPRPTHGRRTPPRISPTRKAMPPPPAPSWRRG